MQSKKVRLVVVYARISVSNEESVSIARQVESGLQYAASRGWDVVAVVTDEGVSATHNKPEDRTGWRRVLAMPEQFDAVVVWKIDRLARRVLDFLNADAALQGRGAGIVSVEEPIDMTTAQGRAFATMLAVFGEMEAAAISARVRGARDYLLRVGRLAGGTVPYGFQRVANPDGPGFYLGQNPDTIDHVRGMVTRVLAGESVYSVKKWLDSINAPLPTTSQKNRKRAGWHYTTVERILRSPVLAGMTAYNPGNRSKVRGDDVLRDEAGMPVIDEAVAIISTEERRKLLMLLDDRDSPQARPRAAKGVTSPLLSGLVSCGECNRTMYRGTTSGRPCFNCPNCYQTITTTQLVPHIESRLLAERGDTASYDTESLTEDNHTELADIEDSISDVAKKMTRDDADVVKLAEQLDALKEQRTKARHAGPIQRRFRIYNRSVASEWRTATDDESRRVILLSQIERVKISRGKTGRYLDPNRVTITWKDVPTLANAMPVGPSEEFKIRLVGDRTTYEVTTSPATSEGQARLLSRLHLSERNRNGPQSPTD